MSAVLRMTEMDFQHLPVLLEPVLEAIVPSSPKVIVDCTLGGAGHSTALLEALPEAHLIGLDRDLDALSAARARLERFGDRVTTVHAPFSDLERVLGELGHSGVDALLADLGVSSHQIDTAGRGFSFRADGPLDMRMDTSSGRSAQEILATIEQDELARIIRTYGEERYAGRVARVVLERQPTTTAELADAVRSVVRQGKDKIDPATRTFQAIRMFVNGELDQLDTLLGAIPRVLNDSGIAALISFHSLEDRAVKHAFRDAVKGKVTPPEVPIYRVLEEPTLELVNKKPIVADRDEVASNSRSRSAKLRVARRLVREVQA